MKEHKILMVGDLHGRFGDLNALISKERPSMVIQVGDFGWWPKQFNTMYKDEHGRIKRWVVEFKNKATDIYWCAGNHEDWDSLDAITDNQVRPRVFYMKRGSTLTLPDGRNVLFMGGAHSIDKKYRTPGHDWFPQETITQRDIEELPDVHIDMVVSHTAPNEFKVADYHEDYGHDPSRDALSYVLNKYKPKRWWFGHMHKYQHGFHDGCIWTCLSAAGFPDRWWIEL